MNIDNKELSAYITNVLNGINDSTNESFILSPTDAIEFEIAVVNKKDANGGIKIQILDVGGSAANEQISKIRFKIRKNNGSSGLIAVGN